MIVDISSDDLRVQAFHRVSVLEMPLASSLGHVVVKGTLEVSSVRIQPLAFHHGPRAEGAHELHSSLVEYIGTLSIFVTVLPLSAVDVLVVVNHHSFPVTLAVLPVTVVLPELVVVLLADAVLQVLLPFTLVGFGYDVFTWRSCVCVGPGTVT